MFMISGYYCVILYIHWLTLIPAIWCNTVNNNLKRYVIDLTGADEFINDALSCFIIEVIEMYVIQYLFENY